MQSVWLTSVMEECPLCHLQARVERLASELEAAVVRAELLSAKGQLYDELRAKADRLQEDNHRLQVRPGRWRASD
jgi:hypothetical protein